MSEQEARAIMGDIKKLLLSKGIWFTVSEVFEEGLKFVKIEASMKVKQ
jgi:hypothetical protein